MLNKMVLHLFLAILFIFIGSYPACAQDSFFQIGEGNCTVSNGCFYSPRYPSNYSNNAYCDISVLEGGTLSVLSFETEGFDFYGYYGYGPYYEFYDFLEINGVEYGADIGPDGVEVFVGDHIYFSSDFSVVESGFEICLIPQPSPLPSQAPTPSPTPVCDRGSYISSETHTCELCEAGRFSNISGHPSNCTLCPAGSFQTETGSTSCTECSSGLSTSDRTDCRACVAGEYAKDNTECVHCESGRYAPSAQVDSCLECYAGDATNNITRATACSSCDAGTYSGDLATSCIDCSAGTYSPERSSSCTDCTAGTYSKEAGSSTCTNCVAGTISNKSATECKDCESGRYQSQAGQSSCVLCAAGTYAPFTARTFCSECDAGRYSSKKGAENCTLCPLGYYQEDPAETECEVCVAGTYSYNKASVDCTVCPPGLDSPQGSASCDWAAVGYFIDTDGDGSTVKCPNGATCVGRLELPKPRKNFWCNRKRLHTVTQIERCARNTCPGGGGNDSCWLPTSFSLTNGDADDGVCDSDAIQCLEGSFGPLCGACSNGYTFSSSSSTCVLCESSTNQVPLIIFLVLTVFILACIGTLILYREKTKELSIVKAVLKFQVVKLLKHIDMGMARVAWSTYQIISSISWNLNVTYPQPFQSLLGALSFLQLDFLSLDCVSGKANFFGRVYMMSIGPIIVALVNVAVYVLRRTCMNNVNIASLQSQHAYAFLLITYLVLPPVSMIHFQSLDCLKLSDGSSYLRSDTSISCDSESYKVFAGLVAMFIFIYQSLPLLWLLLLYKHSKRINPLNSENSNGRDPGAALAVAIESRNQDPKISYLRFLWDVYLPNMWYFEVIDIYRRIMFIGVLPLLGTGSLRATIGCFLSILLAAYFREATPYVRKTTNVLAVVAQYQILANFFGALVILSNSLAVFGLADFGLGCLLLAANLFILILCGLWCYDRYLKEKESMRWRRVLTTQESNILQKIMNATLKMDKGGGGVVKEGSEQRSVALLEQYLLKPTDVILDKKIGAGAFGEVFKGICLGEPVAVKTMKDVTEENARDFRAEILLTATLRHPNIVNFVGACWGRELTCLVLEWVSRGSLQDLLNDVAQDLRWRDPLLRLVLDIARGMEWLHKRKFFDEREQKHFECIIHRDLKPDNVLITEFMSAKITDFGTSRALSDEEMTMTAVGTPIFCAPEVMRGDVYDEKADVYAFGMCLITISMEQNLLDFLRERWCVWNNKTKAPKQPMRIIRPIIEEGWRPVTVEDPISFAPPSINELIVRCCDADHTKRPSFEDIIVYLETATAEEINRTIFCRYGSEGRTAAFRKDPVKFEDKEDPDFDMAYPTPISQQNKAKSFAFGISASKLMRATMKTLTATAPPGGLNPLNEEEVTSHEVESEVNMNGGIGMGVDPSLLRNSSGIVVSDTRKSSLGMELVDMNSGKVSFAPISATKSDPDSSIITAYTEV